MKIFALALLVIATTTSFAGPVRGYTRKSTGKYVAPHHRSHADHTRANNYSTRGNVNPYTGKRGTKSPYR